MTVYDYSAQRLDGTEESLSAHRGQALLIVNTASQCGFTPQYAGLEKLYEKLHGGGLTILGFPCNQFGAQEPGNADEIASFCSTTYGVSFPIMAKVDVNGPKADPLYAWLKSEKGGLFGASIKWNFTKFLVDKSGKVVGRFAPTDTPKSLTGALEKLL